MGLTKVAANAEKFPKDKEVVTLCRRGQRAYQAACTLKAAGVNNVKFVEGGLTCWCGEVSGTPLI